MNEIRLSRYNPMNNVSLTLCITARRKTAVRNIARLKLFLFQSVSTFSPFIGGFSLFVRFTLFSRGHNRKLKKNLSEFILSDARFSWPAFDLPRKAFIATTLHAAKTHLICCLSWTEITSYLEQSFSFWILMNNWLEWKGKIVSYLLSNVVFLKQ